MDNVKSQLLLVVLGGSINDFSVLLTSLVHLVCALFGYCVDFSRSSVDWQKSVSMIPRVTIK